MQPYLYINKEVVTSVQFFSTLPLFGQDLTLSVLPCDNIIGWLSIGSLDGFLYSLSPAGILKKFSKARPLNSVIQVSPVLDCSGYAVYISQTEMEGKISRVIGDYTFISAMKPKSAVFWLFVPATETLYWSAVYPGTFSTFITCI